MTIQEFHVQLTTTADSAPIFAKVRKLMSLDRLQVTAFQESSGDGDGDVTFGGWAVWDGATGSSLSHAAFSS